VVMHGIVLSGGSIYGLDTACGVVKFLDEKGWGFGGRAHVPGAIIFDLGRGRVNAPPGKGDDPCRDGYAAASAAKDGPVLQGSVGAGTGARAGGGVLKSGLGTASTVMDDGTVIGALVVVNAAGKPFNVNSQCELYTLWLELGDEFGGVRAPSEGCRPEDKALRETRPGENTTIGVIATNAPLTGGQTERLAIAANDGLSRAIRPAHETVDGDTVFAVTLAEDPSTVAQSRFIEHQQFRKILAAAADTYSRAITLAILKADPNLGETYCKRYPSACPTPQ
jgi:L-aminopeptidase/D-esterase-like protein